MSLRTNFFPFQISVFLFCASEIATAQTGGIGDPAVAPGTPAQSYALSGIDHVNYYNGHDDVGIPLPMISGRGTASKTSVVRFERQWSVINSGGVYSPETAAFLLPTANANVSLFAIPVNGNPILCANQYKGIGPFATYIQVTVGIGTQTILYDTLYDGQTMGANITTCSQLATYQYTDRGRVFRSVDGTDLTFNADADVVDGRPAAAIAGTLITRDGLRFRFPGGPVGSPGLLSLIEDRNGNTIQYSYDSNGHGSCGGGNLTITDPVGRKQILSSSNPINPPSCAQDVISYPGFNGASRTINVNYDLLQNALFNAFSTGEAIQTYHCLFPELNGSSSTQFNPYVVTSLDLPDGTHYYLRYNAYGELTQLTLPTGAYYTYHYAEASGCNRNSGSGVITLTDGSYKIYRRLLERDEYSDGVNLSAKTVFSATPSASNLDPNHASRPGTTVQVDFQNASGTLLRREKHYFYGDPSTTQPAPTDPTKYAEWWLGLEFRTEIGNGSATLQTTQNVFGQRPCNAGEDCWFTGGVQSDTASAHDPQLCQVNTVLNSGLPSGIVLAYDQYNNLTSKWEFDYGAAPPIGTSCPQSPTGWTRLTSNSYWSQSAYTAASVNILDLIASTAVNPSNGNFANVTYTYDGTAPSDAPGIVGHDSSYGTSYTVRGNPTTISRSSSSLNQILNTTLAYDIAGNVTSVTDPNSHALSISYGDPNNTYAHPTQQINSLSQTTTAQYDNLGTGKITSRTDANGVTTTDAYNDPLDRLTLFTAASGSSVETRTSFTYPSTTQVSEYQDQNLAGDAALHTDAFYDGLGRQIAARTYESSSQYISATQTYDALGRVATSTNPSRPGDGLGYATTYSYDSLGRPTQTLFPDGSSSSASYSGNQVTATDQAGNVRLTVSDGLGRLTSVTEDPGASPHLNYATTYVYDPLDNLTHVTQGLQTRTFNYDNLGWLTSVTQPESGSIFYTYDAAGNLHSRTDARGVQTSYSYDALNRPTLATYSGSPATPNVTYCYDGKTWSGTDGQCNTGSVTYSTGRQTAVGNSQAVSTIAAFDALGRVTVSYQSTGGQNYSFSYGYNRTGAITSETYPSGRTITTSYDPANRASGVTGNGATRYAGALSFAPHGGVTSMTLGNNIVETENYNSLLQPTQVQAGSLLTLGFGFQAGSNNGNLRSQSVARPGSNISQTYGYDSVNRLSSVTQTGTTALSQNYGYDALGNRWVSAYSGLPAPTVEVPQTQSWYLGSNQIGGWSYDASGNVTGIPASSGTTTRATCAASVQPGAAMLRTSCFDAENRMTSVTSAIGATTTYTYDGNGRRVTKTVGTNPTTVFVYDALGSLIAEYGGPANPDSGTRYLTADHLGSTRLVTKADGTVDHTFDYLPFGEEIGGTQTTGPSQRFTGQERDTESGLDHFQARHFSGPQGRFVSPDPVGMFVADPTNPQSWNLYSYAWNNPLRFIDPSGLCSQDSSGNLNDDDSGGTLISPGPCGSTIGDFGNSGDNSVTASATQDPVSFQMASESLDGTFTFFDTAFGTQAQELGLSANGANDGTGFLKKLNTCVVNNAKNYSIGGVANLISNTQIPGSGLASNSITDTYLLATGQDGLLSSLWGGLKSGFTWSKASPIMTNGPNSLTTISPVRGSPQPVLGPGTNYHVSFLGKLAKAGAELKLAVDAGLTGALVLNCSLGQIQ